MRELVEQKAVYVKQISKDFSQLKTKLIDATKTMNAASHEKNDLELLYEQK